jgi:hypothetical protein
MKKFGGFYPNFFSKSLIVELHGVLRKVAFLFWIYVKKIIFLCFCVWGAYTRSFPPLHTYLNMQSTSQYLFIFEE